MNTEDIISFDRCARLGVWGQRWAFPRISLHSALNQALHAGLQAENPGIAAKSKFISLAKSPGLDIQGSVYQIAMHHANLIEVVADYIRAGQEPWVRPPSIFAGAHEFQPTAFLDAADRLHRVVMVAYWDGSRKKEEARSWRTLGDTIATGRPMVHNVVIIGKTINGYRSTPWARCYKHPTTGQMRTCKLGGLPLADSWKKIWREETNISSLGWLKMMQDDKAFDQLVFSFEVQPCGEMSELTSMLDRIAAADTQYPPMRRAGCYWPSLCGFTRICYNRTPTTPGLELWPEKETCNG